MALHFTKYCLRPPCKTTKPWKTHFKLRGCSAFGWLHFANDVSLIKTVYHGNWRCLQATLETRLTFTMQLVTGNFPAVFRLPCVSALLSRYPIALVHPFPKFTMIFNVSGTSSSSSSPLRSDDSCCSQFLLQESGRGKDQAHGHYWSFTAGAILLPGVQQHIQGLQRLGAFSTPSASGYIRHVAVRCLSEIPGLPQKGYSYIQANLSCSSAMLIDLSAGSPLICH